MSASEHTKYRKSSSGSNRSSNNAIKTLGHYNKNYNVANTTEAGSACISPFGVNATSLFTEFINIYSEDNMFINRGDSCFFLLMNTTDYFLPVVCEGIVKDWKFSEGLTRTYYIQFIKFHDTLNMAKLVSYDRKFFVRIWDNKNDRMLDQIRISLLNESFFTSGELQNNQEQDRLIVFSINSFFVRGFIRNNQEHQNKQLQNIIELRKHYLQVIENDMQENFKKLELFQSLINQ